MTVADEIIIGLFLAFVGIFLLVFILNQIRRFICKRSVFRYLGGREEIDHAAFAEKFFDAAQAPRHQRAWRSVSAKYFLSIIPALH